MSKKLDWNKYYKPVKSKVAGTYNSYKDFLAKSTATRNAELERQAEFKHYEPILKKSLLEHIVAKKPIMVLAPFNYLTEKLAKSSDGRSMGYMTVEETMVPGTQLTFDTYDKTLNQFIFKSQNDEEIGIYATPVIGLSSGRSGTISVPNKGYYGLLLSTNIYKDLMEALKNAKK